MIGGERGGRFPRAGRRAGAGCGVWAALMLGLWPAVALAEGAHKRAIAPDADPAIRLCEHLIRGLVRTGSTFRRETTTFGTEAGHPFVQIDFVALAQNNYLMFDTARCRFDTLASKPCAAPNKAGCGVSYTFHSLSLGEDTIVHPQAEPVIRGRETRLGR